MYHVIIQKRKSTVVTNSTHHHAFGQGKNENEKRNTTSAIRDFLLAVCQKLSGQAGKTRWSEVLSIDRA